MRCAILGFASGAALLQFQADLPDGWTIGVLIAAGLAMCLLRSAALALLSGAMLGFCWAAIVAILALAPELSRDDEGSDLTVIGTIASLPYEFDQGVRFHFKVEQANGSARPLPARLALAWYSASSAGRQVIGSVQPGERWRLTVRLQRPHGNANPHGFDYEVWLLEQGVRATGYVRPDGRGNERLDSFVFSVSNVVEHCRATLRARIRRALEGQPYAGVIVALVVGDQRAISQCVATFKSVTEFSYERSLSALPILHSSR